MRLKNLFNKSLLILMSTIMFFALSLVVFNNKTASAATEGVSLYSSNFHYAGSGSGSAMIGEIYIEVSDTGEYYSPLSYKKVYVHGTTTENGKWQDYEASYVTSLSDNKLLYKVTISKNNTDDPYFKFAIRYETNTRQYWDNNNGKDYTNINSLGTAVVTSHKYVNEASPNFIRDYSLVNATLKNLAYHKDVKMVYTTDDEWRNVKEVPLSYSFTNADGSEEWSVKDFFSKVEYNTNLKYYIKYTVNGQTYVSRVVSLY